MQADEQQRADRPIQLGLARRTVAPPTKAEVVRAHEAFGGIDLGDDEQQREDRPAKEAYQPPPCKIRVFKPLMGTLERLTPTPEEEAQLAKQAFKPRAHIVEIVGHSSDDDEDDEEQERLRDALLAHRLSRQEAKEAEEDHI